MLDIRLIRERTEFVKEELAKLGFETGIIDAIVTTDRERRVAIQELESLRARRTATSKTFAKQDAAKRVELAAEMRALGDSIANLEHVLAGKEEEFQRLMFDVPN